MTTLDWNRADAGANAVAIEIADETILIDHLVLQSRDAAEYLRRQPEELRGQTLIQALEVGIYCLQCAGANRDMDFVRLQATSLLAELQRSVERIPEVVQARLLEKIGVQDGQVLAPVRTLLAEVTNASSERLTEVRTLLSDEIDPTKDSTTLGRALRTLTEMLDPKRADSVHGAVEAAIGSVANADGALSVVVRKTVVEAIAPRSATISVMSAPARLRG